MGKISRETRKKRQEELLSLFNQTEDNYEEREIRGDVYVKMFNGNTQRWQVAVYSQKSFNNYKQFNNAMKINHELDQDLARKLADGWS